MIVHTKTYLVTVIVTLHDLSIAFWVVPGIHK